MSGAAAPPAFDAGMVVDLNPGAKASTVTLIRTTDGRLLFDLSTGTRKIRGKRVPVYVSMIFDPADWPNLRVISTPAEAAS